jgi:glutaredoxin
MNTKNHKVIIYSTPTCPYCVYAKDYFKGNNVPFEYIDGNILVGFQLEAFEEFLK